MPNSFGKRPSRQATKTLPRISDLPPSDVLEDPSTPVDSRPLHKGFYISLACVAIVVGFMMSVAMQTPEQRAAIAAETAAANAKRIEEAEALQRRRDLVAKYIEICAQEMHDKARMLWSEAYPKCREMIMREYRYQSGG